MQPAKHSKLLITQIPIIRPSRSGTTFGDGAGLSNYETLPPGEVISFTVGFPRTNGVDPQQFRRAFMEEGLVPVRSMSPARGAAVGKFLLTHFEELGYGMTVEAVEAQLPKAVFEANREFVQATLGIEMPGPKEEADHVANAEVKEAVAEDIAAIVEESARLKQERKWTKGERRDWVRQSATGSVVTIRDLHERLTEVYGQQVGKGTVDGDLRAVGAVHIGNSVWTIPVPDDQPSSESTEASP